MHIPCQVVVDQTVKGLFCVGTNNFAVSSLCVLFGGMLPKRFAFPPHTSLLRQITFGEPLWSKWWIWPWMLYQRTCSVCVCTVRLNLWCQKSVPWISWWWKCEIVNYNIMPLFLAFWVRCSNCIPPSLIGPLQGTVASWLRFTFAFSHRFCNRTI